MADTCSNYVYSKEPISLQQKQDSGNNVEMEQQDEKVPGKTKMLCSTMESDMDLQKSIQQTNKAMALYVECADIITSASGYIKNIMFALEQKQQPAPQHLTLAASEENSSKVPDVIYQLKDLEKVIEVFVPQYFGTNKQSITSEKMGLGGPALALPNRYVSGVAVEVQTDGVLVTEGLILQVEEESEKPYVKALYRKCQEDAEELKRKNAEIERLCSKDNYVLGDVSEDKSSLSEMAKMIEDQMNASCNTNVIGTPNEPLSQSYNWEQKTNGAKQQLNNKVEEGIELHKMNEEYPQCTQCLQIQADLNWERDIRKELKNKSMAKIEEIRLLESENENLQKNVEGLNNKVKSLQQNERKQEEELKKLQTRAVSNENDKVEEMRKIHVQELRKEEAHGKTQEMKISSLGVELDKKNNIIAEKEKVINDQAEGCKRQQELIVKKEENEAAIQDALSSKDECIIKIQSELDTAKLSWDSDKELLSDKMAEISKLKQEVFVNNDKLTEYSNDVSAKVRIINDLEEQLSKLEKTVGIQQECLIVSENSISELTAELEQQKQDTTNALEHNQGYCSILELTRTWVACQVPANCIIPLSVHEDERIKPVFAQLMNRLNSAINGPDIRAKPMSGAEIGIDVGCPVILPCITASRVGSDANAALSKAKVVNAKVILIVYNHLAPHNCTIRTPTESRLTDRSIRDKCLAIVDTVFWNGSMYDCQANEIAVNKLQKLLVWKVSLQKVVELQSLMAQVPLSDH